MRCGAKCFIVCIEDEHGNIQEKLVQARTPAGARKIVRSTLGKETIIHHVMEKKTTSQR